MNAPATSQKMTKINFLLSIFFAVIIFHICATFSYSFFSNTSAYDRLETLLKENYMTVIASTTAEKQILPFLSSDAHLAICRFNTGKSNVFIKAILPEQGWSIVVYDKNGTTLYSDVANPYDSSQVDLYLVPDDERFLGLSLETQIQSKTLNRILIKADEGIAVVRALDAGYGYNSRIYEMLKKASCTEEKRAQKN